MKKNRILRKASALLLAGAMLAGMSITSFAQIDSEGYFVDESISFGNYLNEIMPQRIMGYHNGAARIDIENELYEYAIRVLPQYLMANEMNEEYGISSIYKIHNFDGEDVEKYMVIIFEGKDMAASLTMDVLEDKIISFFKIENFPEVDEALNNGYSVQFGYSHDCFLIFSDNKLSITANSDFEETSLAGELNIDLSLSKVPEIKKNNIRANAVQSGNITYQTTPVVTVVHNALNPDYTDDYKGLCWAACVASVGMHHSLKQGDTALTVYDKCKTSNASKPPYNKLGFPYGNEEWIKFALSEFYNVSALKVGAMSTYHVMTILGGNKPIYCSLRNSQNDDLGHAMVLWSCTYMETSAVYNFMDPGRTNGGGMKSILIDGDTMQNGTSFFISSYNSNTYDRWIASYYKNS